MGTEAKMGTFLFFRKIGMSPLSAPENRNVPIIRRLCAPCWPFAGGCCDPSREVVTTLRLRRFGVRGYGGFAMRAFRPMHGSQHCPAPVEVLEVRRLLSAALQDGVLT